jgi:NitT/TauT family transport system permease protein
MAKGIISIFAGFIFLFLIWIGLCLFIPHDFFPTPFMVYELFIDIWKTQISNMFVTILEAAIGLIIASIISYCIVVIIGLYPSGAPVIYPFITIVKASPAIAFVPLFMIMVGSGILCKMLVAVIIAFFPLIIGGIDGLKQVPQRFSVMAKSYGASRYTEFKNIKYKYATIGFFTGLKTAAPLSVVGAIVGEYVAGGRPTGLGHFLMAQGAMGHMTEVFVGTVFASIIGIMFFGFACLLSSIFNMRAHVDK